MATHTVSPGQSISSVVAGARSGDTVVVKDGTYQGKVSINVSGVTVKAEHEHKAIIDGAGTSGDLIVISGSGITFEGFEVRKGQKGGIVLWDAKQSKVLNNKVHDCVNTGIYIGGSVGKCDDNLVEGNEVFHNVLMNEDRNSSGGWGRGIGIDVSDRTQVKKNKSYNNYGEGIGVMSCIGVKMLENISYDNFSVLLYIDNGQETVAQKNIVYHTGNTEYFRNNKPAAGIQICNENTSRMLPSSGINTTNNTMGDVGKPHYSTYGANTGLKNSTIEPNNIVSASQAEDAADDLWEGGGGTDPTPPDPNPEPEPDKVVTVRITAPAGVRVDVDVDEE